MKRAGDDVKLPKMPTEISKPNTPPSTTGQGGPPPVGEPKVSVPRDGFHAGVPAETSAETSVEPVRTEVVALSPAQREAVVKLKGTCPFIGSALATDQLKVRNSADKPLASVDDVARLGNTGEGSNLGEVLRLFANGNHALMVGPDGKLSREVPPGTFSLDFPASQGSHPGHSGILQGDPTVLNSGAFNAENFERLLRRASDGHIKRSEVGKFIAENLVNDPNSKVFSPKVALLLGLDTARIVGRLAPQVFEGITNLFREPDTHVARRDTLEAVTKLLGEDNLVGSAGEFGLLFAFLEQSPNTKEIDGEPALAVSDLTLMFKEKRLPDGWEQWKKTGHDWVAATTALTLSAGKEYLRLEAQKLF